MAGHDFGLKLSDVSWPHDRSTNFYETQPRIERAVPRQVSVCRQCDSAEPVCVRTMDCGINQRSTNALLLGRWHDGNFSDMKTSIYPISC